MKKRIIILLAAVGLTLMPTAAYAADLIRESGRGMCVKGTNFCESQGTRWGLYVSTRK